MSYAYNELYAPLPPEIITEEDYDSGEDIILEDMEYISSVNESMKEEDKELDLILSCYMDDGEVY